MKQRLLTVITLCMTTLVALAQGPNNTGKYYKRADGLTGAELKTAMFQIIRDANIVNYDGLKLAYVVTDTRADGYLRDFYEPTTTYVPGSDMKPNQGEGTTYNREHVVCKNWYGSADPTYSDLAQVIPTDGWINTMHNDNPFAEVTLDASAVYTSATGYSKWGAPKEDLGVPAGVTRVFEPNDEVKGDIARIYFYMMTCYEDRVTTFTQGKGQYVFDENGTAYMPMQQWSLDMLMRWSALDPVDDVERARNEGVFKVQRNRNPFVDYPGLETYIWGDKKDVAFSYDTYEGQPRGTEIDNERDYTPIESGTKINFTNAFFGVYGDEAVVKAGETDFLKAWTGVRPGNNRIILTGHQGNVDVLYYAGRTPTSNSVGNMFCNDSQIRIYRKNELTLRIADGLFSKLVFEVPDVSQDQELSGPEGKLTNNTWEGSRSEVTFHVNDANGNVQLSSVTIYPVATGIWALPEPEISDEVEAIYDAQGRRIADMQPGLNLVRMKDGRVLKIMK